MNEVQEIKWEECCVCDGEEKGDLRSTTKGIATLAGQFVGFWKMVCYLSIQWRLQLIMLWEKVGQNILISSMSWSEYQQNILITVTFDIHHIT